MKIAIVTDTGIPPISYGGIENNVRTTGELLSHNGHNIHVFAPVKDTGELEFPFALHNVKPFGNLWHSYMSAAITYPVIYRRLAGKLREIINSDFDIVHCHNPFMAGLAGGKIAREKGIASLLHYHFSHTADNHLPKKRMSFAEKLAGVSLKLFDKISVNSNLMKRSISSRFSINENKIEVLPLFVDTDHFKPASTHNVTRTRYEIPEDQPLILYVNRIEKLKGIQFLLEATEEVLKTKKAHLLIVGNGSFLPEAIKLTDNLGIKHVTRFVGEVTRDELRQIYCAADIFVNPSLDEGYSHVILEAASCGKAIIGVDHPILREEFAINGTNSLMCQRGNSLSIAECISTLISDPSLRSKLGSNARETIMSNNNMKIYMKRLLEIYKSLRGQ